MSVTKLTFQMEVKYVSNQENKFWNGVQVYPLSIPLKG